MEKKMNIPYKEYNCEATKGSDSFHLVFLSFVVAVLINKINFMSYCWINIQSNYYPMHINLFKVSKITSERCSNVIFLTLNRFLSAW